MKIGLKILVFLAFSWGSLDAQTIIPGWFENLPDAPAGNMYAVGYSGKYINQSIARQAAIKKALHNMVKQQRTRLVFEIEEYSDGRLRLLDPSLELSYDESILNRIEATYATIDSSITYDGYFILISLNSLQRAPRVPSDDTGWDENKPKWTTSLPKSKNFNYGVGIVSNYSSWVRAWNDADEYARFDLGKNIKIDAHSIHAIERDNKYIIESKILQQSYDENIEGAIIVSRWYDAENDTYYSLCRQKKL